MEARGRRQGADDALGYRVDGNLSRGWGRIGALGVRNPLSGFRSSSQMVLSMATSPERAASPMISPTDDSDVAFG